MKNLFFLTAILVLFAGCDSPTEAGEDDLVRDVRYEVVGQAEQVLIEFIDGDGKVKGTGVSDVPWFWDIEMEVGDRLYLSAWSSETGGGSVQIRVLVDGQVFRTAQNGNDGVRPRISGNAY